jgi:hypothetical protein
MSSVVIPMVNRPSFFTEDLVRHRSFHRLFLTTKPHVGRLTFLRVFIAPKIIYRSPNATKLFFSVRTIHFVRH